MKAKKVLAMLMASAMIMGTSVTAFAAVEPATVTIQNLGDNAYASYVQIIEPDTESPTGWQFTSDVIEQNYVLGFNSSENTTYDAETVIWMLLKYKTEESDKYPADLKVATADQIQKGLEAVEQARGVEWSNVEKNDTFKAEEAGIYAIKAQDTDLYVYSPMAAYVGFDEDYDESGKPTKLEDTTVNAKKTTLDITKSSDETDDVVAIGDRVTYTIDTVVPYIKDNVTNVVYNITDKLTGAKYVTYTDDIDQKEYVRLTVQVGSDIYPDFKAEVTTTMDEEGKPVGEQFTVDLSSIAAIRANANQSLTIQYQADVTNETVNNTVQPNKGDHDFDDLIDGDTLYTGKITMTKFGEDNELLKDAEFVLYYDNTTDGKRYYATFTQDAEKQKIGENEYVLSGWIGVDEKDKDTVPDGVTHIVTDSDGTAVVRGLDDDATYGYMFKEVVAPEGYSINTNDAPIDLWDGNADARATTADMNDTKLSSLPLPSTGGIGTTLFTVGGCTIMVVAAGLYFATRKKEEN